MKLRFGTILVLIIVTTMFCFSSETMAWGKKNKDNCPLYESSSGWQIYGAVRAEQLTSIYQQAKSIADNIPGASGQSIEYWEYMIKRGDDKYLGFVLVIPDGEATFWSEESQITLTYVAKKDTFQLTSTELIFPNACGNCKPAMIRSSEIASYYLIPNQLIYRSPGGYPVVFAYFDFPQAPKKLLDCFPVNVTSRSEKEVNKR